MVRVANLRSSEASLNYFLIQAFASSIILFSILILMICINVNFLWLTYSNKSLLVNLIIIISLILKLGAAPFHFWFPNVIENLSWVNRLILITWQKLAPMLILSYLKLRNFLIVFIFFSSVVGALGGLNQTSLRKLMAFSSINHIGWMIGSLMFNESLWFFYFIIYSYLNRGVVFIFNNFQSFYLSQLYSLFSNSYLLKFCLLRSILSLGGLPPFLGFLPKWLVIQSIVLINFDFIILLIILIRLITLYYYLKIRFAAFMFNHSNFNWGSLTIFNVNHIIIILILTFFSLFGLFIFINFMLVIY